MPAEDGQVQLLIGASGRRWHGLYLLLLVVGEVIGIIRFIVGGLDGGRLLERVVVVIVVIGTTFAGFARSHCEEAIDVYYSRETAVGPQTERQ